MAEALAFKGANVTLCSHTRPAFFDEFSQYPCHSEISFSTPHDNILRACDLVILVPSSRTGLLSYVRFLQAVLCAFFNHAPLVFLNFESYEWFSAMCPNAKRAALWGNWHRVLKYVTHVLSISNEGDLHARHDYKEWTESAEFDFCYPAINSIAAGHAPRRPKGKTVLVYARFSDKHKNSSQITRLFDPCFRGYTFTILCGLGAIPVRIKAQIEHRARKAGVKVDFLEGISEFRKYEEISAAQAVVALSSFEGFGYAPVESRYCGTPCICFDLPVLREVNGDSISYAPQGDYDAIKTRLQQALSAPVDQEGLHQSAHFVGDFFPYANRLWSFVEKITASPFHRSPRLYIQLDKEMAGQKIIATKNVHMMNRSLIRFYVTDWWDSLLHKNGIAKIALYGCGQHTLWLENILRDTKSPAVVALFDDKPNPGKRAFGRVSCAPHPTNLNGATAVVLSTDVFQNQMRRRCATLFPPNIPILDMYKGLPSGPYPKQMVQCSQ